MIKKIAYNLRIFSFAYEFLQALKEEFKSRSGTFLYRWTPHPLNGQIDVFPIPQWYYPTLAGHIQNFSQRRLYMAVAIDPYNPYYSYKLILNLALDLNNETLGLLVVMKTPQKDVVIMADTTRVNYGQHNQIAFRILSKLRKFVDSNGFVERSGNTSSEDNAKLIENFFKNAK